MPYFHRTPIEGVADAILSLVPIPGLPSRGPALSAAVVAGALPPRPAATLTGIVEQATAVLSSERPRINPEPYALRGTGSSESSQGAWAGQLQEQVKVLIDQLVALAMKPPAFDVAVPQSRPFGGTKSPPDTAHLTVEPAPVLSPVGPVAPGGTAQISISLVNEDDQPAQIGFLNTGLVGEDGAQISAENISFQPREVTLKPGSTGVVIARMTIPGQTRCGVYSGLIRASRLDYLHAVLVVQVEKSQV